MKAVFLISVFLEKHPFTFEQGKKYPCVVKDYDIIITLPDKFRTVAPFEVLGEIFYLELDDGTAIRTEQDFQKYIS